MNTVWAGHVEIVIDDAGKKHILFRKDGALTTSTYTPDGFFENKAVNGLVEKLK